MKWWGEVRRSIEELCSEYGVECMAEEDEWRGRRARGGSILDYLG